MMADAESQKSCLKADVNYMENYKALADIKDFEEMQLNQQADFTLQKKVAANSKLPTLGATIADPNVAKQNNSLKVENEKL